MINATGAVNNYMRTMIAQQMHMICNNTYDRLMGKFMQTNDQYIVRHMLEQRRNSNNMAHQASQLATYSIPYSKFFKFALYIRKHLQRPQTTPNLRRAYQLLFWTRPLHGQQH